MGYRLYATLFAAGVCAVASAEPSNMRPGLWRITTETSMPGMPVQMPAQTLQHCYTAEQLAQARNAIPQSGEGNGDCKVSDYRLEGNSASWTIECGGEIPMHGSGTMTTEPTRYQGRMKMVMDGPQGAMEMSSSWRAERIGECR